MTDTSPARRHVTQGFLPKLRLFTAFPVLAGLLVAGLAAQDTPPKAPKEEELPVTSRPKKVLRVADEPQTTSLAAEADQATNPELQNLYRSLAVPHDLVTLTNGTSMPVAPLNRSLGTRLNFSGRIELHPYNDQWQPQPALAVFRREIGSVDFYEQIALRKVNEFLKKPLDQKAQDLPEYVSRLDMLQAAEKVLAAVITFHDSARERGQKGGDELVQPVRDRLLEVQLEQLAAQPDWSGAYELAARLAEAYPRQEDLHTKIAAKLVPFIKKAIDDGDYEAVHLRMKLVEDIFPRTHVLEEISQTLQQKAKAKFEEGMTVKGKDASKAMSLFHEAEAIWPRLPDLRYQILQLSKDHPILYVGVRKLPENLLPAMACTDCERLAVELLFDSLVVPVVDAREGQRYLPRLSKGRPELIPLGRRFSLVSDAYWSNGERVTAVDVRHTWQLLQEQGRADLIDEVRPGDDAFHVDLTLRQGYLDPLSLMTFKVLPASMPTPDQPAYAAFAQKPVGSGPYQYQGRVGDRAVFIANPGYSRSGKAGLPRIPEIQFLVSKDPAGDFQKGQLHVLLDLPTSAIRDVRSVASVQTLRNRRIYFLAVNHRNPSLGENGLQLRRAIANAIDREKILNDFFRDRGAPPPAPHRALNGPYPPGSWACNDKLEPFDLKLAAALAKDALGAVAQKSFTLKYPDDDPQVAAACNYICKTVSDLGIGLKPEPRSPEKLRQEVELMHDYDLAYYCHDYPTEAYYLWPLFDPSSTAVGRGGRNYLGYHNDGVLVGLFQKAMEHRDFSKVQELTHEIHAQIFQKVPFIPLWQLDTNVAMRPEVKPKRIDPLLIFADVEEWELKPR